MNILIFCHGEYSDILSRMNVLAAKDKNRVKSGFSGQRKRLFRLKSSDFAEIDKNHAGRQ